MSGPAPIVSFEPEPRHAPRRNAMRNDPMDNGQDGTDPAHREPGESGKDRVRDAWAEVGERFGEVGRRVSERYRTLEGERAPMAEAGGARGAVASAVGPTRRDRPSVLLGVVCWARTSPNIRRGRWASLEVAMTAEIEVGTESGLRPGTVLGAGRYAVGNSDGHLFAVTRRCRHLGAEIGRAHV